MGKGGIWRLFKKYVVVRGGNLLMLPILFLAAPVSKLLKKKYDIGIGPMPLINNIYFKKALEQKGYSVETFAEDIYYITSEFDFIYDKKHNKLLYYFPSFVFLRSLFCYKMVYIYFDGYILHGIPILRRVEPFLLKMAGIKIVVMPYGSDHQSFKNAKNLQTEHFLCQDYSNYYKLEQPRIEQDVVRWTRKSDIVLAHQDCVDYLPYWDEVRWSLFGIDTDQVVPILSEDHDTVRIFHAPNHRGIKGTDAVEKAIKNLKDKGYKIEYIYAHGVSNSEVISLIQKSDIVVDQLVLGAYSVFSMESMACGKPVVCHIRKDLNELYEASGAIEKGELPIIDATVFTIEEVLEELIKDPEKIKKIGVKSREYVVKYHSLNALGDFYDTINRRLGLLPKKIYQ